MFFLAPVTEQSVEFTFGSWKTPEIPLAIEYPLEVMDEIRAAATEGLMKLSRGGLEVAGVLFGARRPDGIRILTWRPISCEHARGPTLQLSERDRTDLTRLLEGALQDPDLRGLQPVGWFLSHTRSDVMLSPNDLEVFNSFFPEPWQVTLVLRPTQGGPARAGFFVRDAEGALRSESSYQEFTIKPLHRAPRPPDPPKPAEPPRPLAKEQIATPKPPIAVASPDIPMPQAPARATYAPLFRTLERPAPQRRWLAMLPVVLGLMVAGFFVKERYLPVESPSLSFHVSDTGETVQIEWNQNAKPVRNAHVGVIDVTDSGQTKRYSLGDDELHTGKMTYLRQGRDLELRMTVYPVGGTAVHEFVRFLDPGPVAPPPAAPDADQLRKERDRLEAEVNQLKQDLRKERTGRRRR